MDLPSRGNLRLFSAMSDIKFSCPKCGHKTFKTSTEPKCLEDFNGAVCENCGTVVTEDDIKAQLRELADKLVRDAFRKSGLK